MVIIPRKTLDCDYKYSFVLHDNEIKYCKNGIYDNRNNVIMCTKDIDTIYIRQ